MINDTNFSNRLNRLGPVLFGIGIIGIGVIHIYTGDFLVGRPPAWPSWLPGQKVVSILSGALLIITGLLLSTKKITKHLALAAGIMVLLWSGLRNMIEVVAHLNYGAALTSMNKALTLGGGILLMAEIIKPDNTTFPIWLWKSSFRIERYFIGFFLFSAGIQHFIFASFVRTLIPSWIPAPDFWTYFAGVALMASGVGLLAGVKAKLAALLSAAMIFIWVFVLHLPRAITMANVNEWTAVFEATAVSGVLFAICVVRSSNSPTSLSAN